MVPSGRIPQAKHGRKPYPIPEAGTPAGGSGGAEAKEKKVRSCAIAHAPAVRIFYGGLHAPRPPISPWLYIP